MVQNSGIQDLLILYNPKTAKPGYQRLPMSLLQLGAFLEGRFPYAVVDGNLDQGEDHAARIIDIIKTGTVKYLGVTIMPGPQLQRAVPDIKRIKEACPHIITIIGGYFPTVYMESCANDPDIDYVVVGPGEITLMELLEVLEKNGDAGSVDGLAFMREGVLVRTPDRPPVNPEDLPPIPYHRVDVQSYIAETFLGSRTLSLHTSFGCPFRCNFCGVAAFSKGAWLAESAGRVVEEVQEFVDRWQMDALEFHDSHFFVSEKRVAGFCRGILDRSIRIHWWGQGRIDTLLEFSPYTWELMRDSGLKMVFLGAESADDDILKRMNKGGSLTTKKTLEMAAVSRQYGIVPEFSFICGNPPDPRADILKTIAFIRRIKKINPLSEIVLYRYDPIPIECDMFKSIAETGFRFPQSLAEWADPEWEKVHRRREASLPWLADEDHLIMKDFETVLNAYYPTSTHAWLVRPGNPWRYLLRMLSSWRYRLRFYRWPYELEKLQHRIHYRRPETSGFGK